MNRLLSLCVLAAAVSPSFADEPKPVDNPQFASWSKFETGTTVTRVFSTDGGESMSMTITTRLVEKTADKCVVEVSSETATNGQRLLYKPRNQDVPKLVDAATAARLAERQKPAGTYEEGTETLTVGGTEIKTRWYKFKAKEKGQPEIEGQVWVSEDVPTGVVKRTTTAEKSSSTETVTQFSKN